MSYPRETKEAQQFRVECNDVKVLIGVEVAVLSSGIRPTPEAWKQPIILDDELGIMVDGLALQVWHIWARITSTPEVVVIYCGDFKVT